MYTAMSLNLEADTILTKLNSYSKNLIIPRIFIDFIKESTRKSGSAYLYMMNKKYYIKIHEPFLQDAIYASKV